MGVNSDVVLFRVKDKRELKAMAKASGFRTVSAFVHYKVFGGNRKLKDDDSKKLDGAFSIN